MRWKLPGGAVLGDINRVGDDLAVACRPQAAVVERLKPPSLVVWQRAAVKRLLCRFTAIWNGLSVEQLARVKLLLGILIALLTLLGTILALLGWLQR